MVTEMEQEFFLPELPQGLPCLFHPDTPWMEAESNGWIRQFMAGCYPSMTALMLFLQQRNAVFGALVSPLASRERARGIIDFYQYVTVFDDMCGAGTRVGSDPELYNRVRDRLVGAFSETTPRDDHPLILGGLDLLRRLSEGMSPAQQQRLIRSVTDFGKGIEWEVFSRNRGHHLGIPEYLRIRYPVFGGDFILLLAEYAAEVDMSSCQEVETVSRLAIHHLIAVNDLFSYRKEILRHDSVNLVAILRSVRSLQEAVQETVSLIERYEREYMSERDRLLSGPLGSQGDVRSYLRCLDHLLGGNKVFHLLTPRYFGPGYVWDGTTSGWFSLKDPTTHLSPVPHHRTAKS
jgi:hypothetical protein